MTKHSPFASDVRNRAVGARRARSSRCGRMMGFLYLRIMDRVVVGTGLRFLNDVGFGPIFLREVVSLTWFSGVCIRECGGELVRIGNDAGTITRECRFRRP